MVTRAICGYGETFTTLNTVVWAVRAVGVPRPGSSISALEVLKRRLAAGEITQDEYEKTRRLLEG